ncbi:MAG: LysM peptidoglycan-binding domain-containing protein [Candidatus Aminicenantes bacterium]|nr:LysM peptidoglycan-binding domain-containing protein [Candidatus Aminicenantes bacterium]
MVYVSILPCSHAFAEEIFSVPDNLKDNVAFWKKIYTEISLKQGVIHDREYPLIIYKVIDIGNRKGRSRSRYARYHRKAIAQILKNMAKKPPSQWTAEEQKIGELFLQYARLEELKTAASRVRFQQGQKERFKQGLERSGAYMPFIRSVFKMYSIPERIVYLPHVESSFNIHAYSRVGAAGMWQFMRRTGRLFSLKIGYRIDERWDPIKSTIAAARLLRKNYEELKSWPLAITAYNHGLASIKRAVRVTRSRDLGVIIEKYKNRRFRFASKNFYGCFLAASEIAADANTYFSNINYHLPLAYREVQLKSYMRPKTLAKYLEISERRLKDLNPSLRPIVFRRQLPIPPGYNLRIPWSMSPEMAKEKLAAIPGSVKKSTPQIQHYYTVRRGDTLYGISRRFRVSTEDLIISNQIRRENRIYIGQVLRIPGRDEISPGRNKTAKTQEIEATTAKPAKAVSKPVPNTTPATAAPTPSQSKELNTQQTQQTPPAETKTKPIIDFINAIKEALEKPENSGSETPGASFDATLYNLDVKVLQGTKYAFITAAVDETMGHYAEWLNTSVRRLRSLNRGRRHIKVNQKIKIPLRHPNSLEQFNTQRLEYHMAQEEDFYSQYQVVDTKTRIIAYGDTLWSICNRDEEIPIWLLKKYNRDIDLEALKVKMKLTIPVLAPKANGNNNNK